MLGNKGEVSVMGVARFPHSTPLYDSHRMVVLFVAIVSNETIGCAISHEALTDHFENNALQPAAAFSRHRAAIERIAEKLISQKRFESDGSILIRTADC
jgi:hypothetical protein